MNEEMKKHMISSICAVWNDAVRIIDDHCIQHSIMQHDRVELVAEVFSEGLHRIISAVAMNDEAKAIEIRANIEHQLNLPWLDVVAMLQDSAQSDPEIRVVVMKDAADVHNILAQIFGERKLDS